jgi:uncharacterized peroxidase-related enzyme
MFLATPADTAATSRLYEDDLNEMGFVMNLSRAWAWRPEVCEGFAALRGLLTTKSSLSPQELAVMVCSTAASLGDSYCALAWGKRLAGASDPSTAAAVLRGWGGERLGPRGVALSRWTRKVVKDPNATTAEDVDELRAAGLSEQEIFEATVFIALRLAFSTVNDALGVTPDWQVAAAAPPEVRSAVTFGRASDQREGRAVEPVSLSA